METTITEKAPDLTAFWETSEEHHLYPESAYIAMITEMIEGTILERHITVTKEGIIVGYIPALIYKNEKYGNVLNSLPYFGSNGSLVVQADLSEREKIKIKKELLRGIEQCAKDLNCIYSCVITSPFDSQGKILWEEYDGIKDWRYGQITPLHLFDTKEALIKGLSRGARVAYQKGIQHCEIKELGINDIDLVYDVHISHMNAINGKSKSRNFFQYMLSDMKEYTKIKGAFVDGELIAFILMIYANGIITYFTPGYTIKNYDYDGTSAIVVEEMIWGMENGFRYFDFGGTWPNQKNIHTYKRKFAAVDMNYYYLIKEYCDNKVKSLSSEEILEEYPNFYLFPFN